MGSAASVEHAFNTSGFKLKANGLSSRNQY